MRVVNLDSNSSTVTKKVIKNGGQNMNNVVEILPNKVKDMSLAKLGRSKNSRAKGDFNRGFRQRKSRGYFDFIFHDL